MMFKNFKVLLPILITIFLIFCFTKIGETTEIKDLKYAVIIPEEIIQQEVPDPAAETEIIKQMVENGFYVIDQHYIEEFRYTRRVQEALQNAAIAADLGKELGVDVLVIGEAFAERIGEEEGLVSYRARVEVRAIETDTGRILYTHGVHAPAHDITDMTAAKSAFKTAATEWVIDFIPMEPPEKFGLLIPRFAFGDKVDHSALRDIISTDIAEGVQRALLQDVDVSDKIAILSTGEERAEAFRKIQRGDFELPALLLQGTIDEFEIRELDKLSGIFITKYALEFRGGISWNILDQTGNRIIMGNRTESIEFEATYTGLGDVPSLNEMAEDHEIRIAIDKIIEEIKNDVIKGVFRQIETDQVRYQESALARRYEGVEIADINHVIEARDGSIFRIQLMEEISFQSSIMGLLTFSPDEIKEISRDNYDSDAWSIKTIDGDYFSGKINMEEIKAEIGNNIVHISVDEIISITISNKN